jgi:hypothetical protein
VLTVNSNINPIIPIVIPAAHLPHTAILKSKKGLAFSANPLLFMVGDAGFEPTTPAV